MFWNGENRLAWVSSQGSTTHYGYDADGKRILKKGPNGTTRYFGNLFEVEDATGAASLVKYYYAGEFLLARQEGGTRLWYHQDHLGSVRAMTSSGGVRQVGYEYAAFGDVLNTFGSADNARGFGAHWRDEESHLVYMGGRYHDPVIGRFTQPDPVIPEPGDPQSWNRYSYVRNNPVNRIDPTGHADLDLGAALGGNLAQRIGVNQAFGRLAGSLANGVIPGAGELADLGVLFSLDHKVGTLERLVAVGSLVGSVGSFGTSPNVGSAISKADEAIEAASGATSRVVSHADEATEAARGTTRSGIGVTRHGVDQKITRGVRTADELDAIKNPLQTRSVKVDDLGRPSQRVIGRKAEVVRNPETGEIISVNPTSTKKADRLLRQLELDE
jgi:RHS repeat-associated protein